MSRRTTYLTDSSDEHQPPEGNKAGKPKLSPLLYKATVASLADEGTIPVSASMEGINETLLQRIKKCIVKANHPNTPEAEVKAALHLASRMMAQYNITQAEVLAHEPASERKKYGGQSVVAIKRVDAMNRTPVLHESYVDDLRRAMRTFFDCKSYTESSYWGGLTITFYGIAENTVAAAMGFEMAYNLIAEWKRSYKGRAKKNSYALGVAQTLAYTAEEEKMEEEARAKQTEKDSFAKRESQKAAPSTWKPTGRAVPADYNTSDSDEEFESALEDLEEEDNAEDFVESDFRITEGDSIDPEADLDQEIRNLIKSEPSLSTPRALKPSKYEQYVRRLENPVEATPASAATAMRLEQGTSLPPSDAQQEGEAQWASHMQLMTFRETATNIAEDYLKAKGVKLGKARSRNSVVRDRAAYNQGAEDSKKIDVRRKRIKE